MSSNPTSSNGHGADLRKLIYVVDDEPMLLELASMIIEAMGYRVETFRDPLVAVRAFTLANPLPVLVMTDYAMHRMNGMDLIRDCRRVHPQQKILMVSGTVDEAIYRGAPDQPDEFLAKPYQAAELIAKITALLK